LDVSAVEGAHLILTAEAQHRGAVVAMNPKARSRVFTLNEAASLTDWYLAQVRLGTMAPRPRESVGPNELLRWWVSELNDSRGAVAIPSLDIEDPHSTLKSPDAHPETAAAIQRSIWSVAAGFSFAAGLT
jgi:protein-tyrosine-phosphatase